MPGERGGPGPQFPALARAHHRVPSARRTGGARGHAHLRRVHRAALLRLAPRQGHRPRQPPPGGARPYAPGAGLIYHRGRDHDHSVPGPGAPPPRLPGRDGGHEVPRAGAAPPQRVDMKIDVYFTPLGLNAGDLSGRGVVVVDVLRATTSIVTALANGAKAVVPAATSEEAVRLTANLEKNGYVLAGERKSLKIEGFPLGNSPREMTAEVAAAVNFSAVAERARAVFEERGDLVIVCAGREKQFALEDGYVAGRLVKAVRKGRRKIALNDAATVVLDLPSRFANWAAALGASEAARELRAADLGEDVAFSAKADRFSVVPSIVDRRIVA